MRNSLIILMYTKMDNLIKKFINQIIITIKCSMITTTTKFNPKETIYSAAT